MEETLRRIINEGKNFRRYQIIQFLAWIPPIIITAVTAFLVRDFIDALLAAKSFNDILFPMILVIAIAILSFPFSFLSEYFSQTIQSVTGAEIEKRIYMKIPYLPPPYFEKNPTGELIAKATSDIVYVGAEIVSLAPAIAIYSISITVAALVLFFLDPLLAGIALAFAPLYFLALKIFKKKLMKSSEAERNEYGRSVEQLREEIEGVRTIQSYNKVDFFNHKFSEKIDGWIKSVKRVYTYNALNWSLFSRLSTIVMYITLGIGGFAIVKGYPLTVGTLVGGVYVAIGALYSDIESLTRSWTTTQKALPVAKRVFELLDEPEIVIRDGGPFPEDREMEFRKVSFSYGKKAVLENVNLRVGKGEGIAIVGQTGAGKSTLVSLLLGFYESSNGKILLGGKDVENYSSEDLRKNILYVSAGAYLFNMSIKENIVLGDNFSDEELRRVAEMCCIDSPDINIVVGERGITLSSGQRQRVALARALIRKPRILILDEATSAVDAEIEERIFENMKELDMTTITVSHRLSTILKMERIAVMDKGTIVATGKHGELLNRCGEYGKLFEQQMVA